MRLNAAAPSVCVFNDDIGLKLEMLRHLLIYSVLHERQKNVLCEPEKRFLSVQMKHILEL